MTFSKNIIQIAETLKGAGFQALIAGGAVRDMLLGVPAHDFDFATNATPDQVENLFPKTLSIGKSFGVIVVIMPDGEEFEIATFRSDSENSDGRRPDAVQFETDPRADASRRDFTINAMFLDPLTGKVFDFFGGQNDLKKGLVRFVGNPTARIQEDKLRMMRAVRFASKPGFSIEGESFLAVKKNAPLISCVSFERIRAELLKMLSGPTPDRAVLLLTHTGIMGAILPSVTAMVNVEQLVEFHPEGDVFNHTVGVVKHLAGKPAITVLAGLLHDIGKPGRAHFNEEKNRVQFIGHDEHGANIAEVVMRRLKFSNAEIEEVVFAVREHMKMHKFTGMKLGKKRILAGEKHFTTLFDLSVADSLSTGKEPVEMINAVAEVLAMPNEKPLINGLDLIELGFKPGPIFSKILKTVRLAQLDGRIKTVEQAIKMARGIR